jgi:cytoskeletal protein CcmA (bactofilin family)
MVNPLKRRMRDASNGPTTFVAPSTNVIGKITGKGVYVFCGTVVGDCEIDGPVTLAEGGKWQGTLQATDVVVAGTVLDDVIASQRVEITATARVSGSLSGSSIAVAEGAVIEGEINVTSGAPPVKFEEKRKS